MNGLFAELPLSVRHPGTGHHGSYYHPRAQKRGGGSRAKGAGFKAGERGEAGARRGIASHRRQKKVSRFSHQSFFHHPVSCQDSSLGIQLVAR